MMAPETKFLIQALQKVAPGETIFYSDLNESVGNLDVRQYFRSRLTSALNIVKRDYGMIFVAIPDVGYQLMKQEDVSAMAESKGLSDVKRAADRWEGRLNTVEYANLDEKGKDRYGRSCTKLALVSYATTEKAFQLAEKKPRPMNQFKPTKEDIMAAIEYGVS
jgi:hypothetical protein